MRVGTMVWTTALAVSVMAASGAAMAQGSTQSPSPEAKPVAASPSKPAAVPAKAAPAAAAATKAENGYEYRFQDDLMQGNGIDANAPRITVRKMGRRDQLIRPRLHFVPELQKSVEKM